MSISYFELQALSNFSFLRGGSHPEELIAQAHALGLSGLALTDRNSLAGVVRAHVAAKSLDYRFIVGVEIVFEVEPQPYSLLLYPEDLCAYGNLCELLTSGKMRAPKGACYLSAEDVSACSRGMQAIIVTNAPEELRAVLPPLQQAFSCDSLSLAISRNYCGSEEKRTAELVKLSKETGIALVATNNILYHAAARRPLQDCMSCIREGVAIEDAGFLLEQNAERYIKPPEELRRLFHQLPQALERSAVIARRISFSLDEVRYEYPQEICPTGLTPQLYLRELVEAGARSRYPAAVPLAIEQQLEYELALIEELDYAKYFLTVYDIVSFAKGRGILCQGRGAAANSAVCYVLGITAVNPAEIRLMIERFISKERNEPPDIDIDFEHERREEVIQYIYQKYGRFRAALVCEVICFRSKSAFREVAKVFRIDEAAMLALRKVAKEAEGAVTEADFARRGLSPDDKRLWQVLEIAAELRAFPRHLSQHVGGFIIAKERLSRLVPIAPAAMSERSVVEWDKDDIEALGMLKIDCLGLGMLSCIRKAFVLINRDIEKKRAVHGELSLHTVPGEDPAVYQMIARADTLGIFQIESRAQMAMLPKTRPQTFYDLVVQVAIVRPGPIQGGMVHPYIRRRNKLERVIFPNKQVREILERTLGVPIFQEQIMELAVVCAGFTPGESDKLRRAMASWKKKGTLIEQFGRKILDGMRANGYSRNFAERVFRQIKGFSEYGFPQSHAASFALLVYVSSWLKWHYPDAFAAALINSQPMGFYQPAQILSDAQKHGAIVYPVDVLKSGWDCRLTGEKGVRLGMRLVRGMREAEARLIETWQERRQVVASPGLSLRSFWQETKVSVSTLKLLSHADAFAALGLTRQEALWEIRRFRDEPLPLFSNLEEQAEPVQLPALSLPLHVFKDYETTGLSLRAHPLSFLRAKFSRQGVVTAAECINTYTYPQGVRVEVVGLVLIRQQPHTASGVVFLTVEDESGVVNIVVKSEVLAADRDAVRESMVVRVRGRLQRDYGVVHLVAEEVFDESRLLAGLISLSRDFH